MNRKWTYGLAATLILIALVIGLRRMGDAPQVNNKAASRSDQSAPQTQAATSPKDAAVSAPTAPSSQPIDAAHKEDVKKGLQAIVEGLKQMGAKEIPPIAEELKAAVASGDAGIMLRAFNEAIYGRFAQMTEAIPALKAYLQSPDPHVRYLAAETLLRVGDKSGVPMLVDTINSKNAVLNGTTDLRFTAARMLGRYNVIEAAQSLSSLYQSTKDTGVLNAQLHLQKKNASKETIAQVVSSRTPGFVLFNLGLAGLPEGETFARDTFMDPKVPSDYATETKMIAAWALARSSGEAQYVNYLIEAALPAIAASKDQTSFNPSTEALRYLGSVQTPAARSVLEEALNSQNPTAVQYATVNLLFNQPGGSQKAEQLVLTELQTTPSKLGTDLAMQIASQLNNPAIKAAAQSFDRKTGGDRWRYWGVERSNWPIQNWVYDYAVTLNP